MVSYTKFKHNQHWSCYLHGSVWISYVF